MQFHSLIIQTKTPFYIPSHPLKPFFCNQLRQASSRVPLLFLVRFSLSSQRPVIARGLRTGYFPPGRGGRAARGDRTGKIYKFESKPWLRFQINCDQSRGDGGNWIGLIGVFIVAALAIKGLNWALMSGGAGRCRLGAFFWLLFRLSRGLVEREARRGKKFRFSCSWGVRESGAGLV